MSEYDDYLDYDKIIKELNNKYFLLAISDAVAFSKLITAEIPDYFEKYKVEGFSIEDLNKFADKFLEYNVTAVFIKLELMNDMVNGAIDLGKLYCFKPLIGTEKKGILLPEPYDMEAGKPKRESTIDDIDVKIMGNKLDDFNSGKISFEEFLGSI